jgi:hypothetical protein
VTTAGGTKGGDAGGTTLLTTAEGGVTGAEGRALLRASATTGCGTCGDTCEGTTGFRNRRTTTAIPAMNISNKIRLRFINLTSSHDNQA